MDEAIRNFHTQFKYEPQVIHGGKLGIYDSFIIAGMGGSALAPALVAAWKPDIDILVHRDYGLPRLSEEKVKHTLLILTSYSGNTEEVLDTFSAGLKRGIPLAAIAVGGKLLTLAREHAIPHIELPDTGIQPRSALGFLTLALLKLLREDAAILDLESLAIALDPLSFEAEGKRLAEIAKDRVPVIYTSTRNAPLAYNWKIKLNETGKIPAFYNVLPELNHNEMTGFDVTNTTRELNNRFYFIFLEDENDDPRIRKRMSVLRRLYAERGLPVERIPITGSDYWHALFSSLLLADWFAYHTARLYGLEPEQVPMVEDFKRLLE